MRLTDALNRIEQRKSATPANRPVEADVEACLERLTGDLDLDHGELDRVAKRIGRAHAAGMMSGPAPFVNHEELEAWFWAAVANSIVVGAMFERMRSEAQPRASF